MLVLLAGCVPNLCEEVEALPAGDTFALGDSVLAWNAEFCQSVADHTAIALGASVSSSAVSGSELLGGSTPIPDQWDRGEWANVVVDGGGNDLKAAGVCDGEDPTPLLDGLASVDGTSGAMPDLVDTILGSGASVLLLGYYTMSTDGWYGLGPCPDELALLGERYATLAASRDNVDFLDLRDTLGPNEVEVLDFDGVHPDPDGARLLGETIAAALADQQPEPG